MYVQVSFLFAPQIFTTIVHGNVHSSYGINNDNLTFEERRKFQFRTETAAMLAKFRRRDKNAFDALISASYLRADFVA